MTSEQKITIAIIVDNVERENEGRFCFWRDLCKGLIEVEKRPFEFRFVSLCECVEKGKNPIPEIFNIKKTQLVIINWDAINGDLLYGSDKALHLLQHFVPDMDLWVKGGGIMLVECQEGSRRLRQEAYDLFGMELGYPLAIQEEKEFGNRVHVNEDLIKSHPLLIGLSTDDNVVEKTGVDSSKPLYPAKKSTDGLWDRDATARWQTKIYLGWFDIKRMHRDWEPLIFARGKEFGKKRPVMLCRTVRGERGAIGAYIVTSMFIGSSGWSKLIENIFGFYGEPARNAHHLFGLRKQVKKKEHFALAVVGFLGAVFLAAICLFYPGQLGALFGAAVIGIGTFFYRVVRRYVERAI